MFFEQQVVKRSNSDLIGDCDFWIADLKSKAANRKVENPEWGCSSVGRAVALQAIGQEFESPQLHQHLNAECKEHSADTFCSEHSWLFI